MRYKADSVEIALSDLSFDPREILIKLSGLKLLSSDLLNAPLDLIDRDWLSANIVEK